MCVFLFFCLCYFMCSCLKDRKSDERRESYWAARSEKEGTERKTKKKQSDTLERHLFYVSKPSRSLVVTGNVLVYHHLSYGGCNVNVCQRMAPRLYVNQTGSECWVSSAGCVYKNMCHCRANHLTDTHTAAPIVSNFSEWSLNPTAVDNSLLLTFHALCRLSVLMFYF